MARGSWIRFKGRRQGKSGCGLELRLVGEGKEV